MATRVVVGIVALACISTCGLVATFANFEMVDKVNAKLPKGQQFAPLGWYWSKRQRLHREYKRLYPEGRLLLKVRVVTALMFACSFALGVLGSSHADAAMRHLLLRRG